MKGLKTIARKSQNINQRDRSTWIKLYYDFSTDTVSMKATKNNGYINLSVFRGKS